jgi:hypothetical protein
MWNLAILIRCWQNLNESVRTDAYHGDNWFIMLYRAGHVRHISEFILYATKNTNDADHLIPIIM